MSTPGIDEQPITEAASEKKPAKRGRPHLFVRKHTGEPELLAPHPAGDYFLLRDMKSPNQTTPRQAATRWYALKAVTQLGMYRESHPELSALLHPVRIAPLAELGRIGLADYPRDERERHFLDAALFLVRYPQLSAKEAATALRRWRLQQPPDTAATEDEIAEALLDVILTMLDRHPRTPFTVLETALDQFAATVNYLYGDDMHLANTNTNGSDTTGTDQ